MADSATKEGKSVEFSVAESDEREKASKRRSSFFKNLSQSFRRSGGERGADVESLRGKHGPNFEGYAIINRGAEGVGCGCFGRKDMKERLILIKGPFIFVYNSENEKAPKYAVSLAHLNAVSKGTHGGSNMVTLETTLGDVEYEVSFKEKNIANQFIETVNEQAVAGEVEEQRKRLGHGSLLSKRDSLRYAEKVAMKKIDDQPEKEERLTAEDMARVTGTATMAM